MTDTELDRINLGILYLLQSNARHNTTEEIGEQVGLSASAVGTRIRTLEEKGIIKGYHPTVDYEKTGFEHHLLVSGTAPFDQREEVISKVRNVSGVSFIRKLLTDEQNVIIEVIGRTRPELTNTLYELHQTGLSVDRMDIIEDEITQPVDHVGNSVVESE